MAAEHLGADRDSALIRRRGQVVPRHIPIRTGDLVGDSDAHAVGVDERVVGDEQHEAIVLRAVLDVRALDRPVDAGRTPGDECTGFVAQPRPRLRRELDEMDASEERSVDHPRTSCAIERDGGVDRVVRVAVMTRRDHDALIGPGTGRAARRGQADRRGAGAERRGRVVHVPARRAVRCRPAHHLGGPQPFGTAPFLRRGRHLAERGAVERPGDEICRGADVCTDREVRDAGGGIRREHVPEPVVAADHGRVMRVARAPGARVVRHGRHLRPSIRSERPIR